MTEALQIDEGNSPELVAIIRERIRRDGPLRFDAFMELCLYHPEHGYYMTERARIGKAGDFFTSSSVHAVFGRLLARQVAQMWTLLGSGPFTIAEQGGGEGYLALDILDALAEEHPDCYRQIRYLLIEVSPGHRSRQRQRLNAHGEKVRWGDEAELLGLEGCLLSNELVDALPVRLFDYGADGWSEILVDECDGEFVERRTPVSQPQALAEHFQRLGVTPVCGNRYEWRTAAGDWMRTVGRALGRGFVLTIDYGYLAAELYAPWRRGGTVMCYHRHQASDDPFRRVGRQDITAHVDFSALQALGLETGLEPLFYGEQCRFLLGLGFVDALLALQSRVTDAREALALRMTLKTLIMPDGGMGETFKVLIQGKGVGKPELLCARALAAVPLS